MKTALQDLIDRVNLTILQIENRKNKHSEMDFGAIESLKSVVEGAIKLKEYECKIIMDAYLAGTAQFANDAEILYPKTPNDYYIETFNN